MAMTREQLLQAFGALANTQALRRQEEQKKVAPQVLKPVVKPVWNESKVPVTPQLQQRNLDIAKKVVSTTPGAFAYGVGRGISMPVTAAAKLIGYQESPEEAAVRTLAESKRLTAQMDASKGMGQPNIIQGRSIAPEMVGKVVGSILPFSKAEAAAGALLPQIAGAGIKNTAIRGAISGGALQGIEEAGQGKRGMELAGSVALGTALGAGADIGLGYLGKAIRNIKAGQKVSEAVAEIAQKAPESRATIQQELGLPEGSTWADIERQIEAEAKRAELDKQVERYYQSLEERTVPPVKEQKAPFTGTEQYGVPSGKTYDQFAYEQEQAQLADEYMKLLEEGVSAGEAAKRVYPGRPFSGTEQYGVPEGMDYATYQKKLDEEAAVNAYYKRLEENPEAITTPEQPSRVPSLYPRTPDRTTNRVSDVGIPQGIVPKTPFLAQKPKGPMIPLKSPQAPDIERELFPPVMRQPTPVQPQIPQTQPVTPTLNKIAPQVNTAPIAPSFQPIKPPQTSAVSMNIPKPITKTINLPNPPAQGPPIPRQGGAEIIYNAKPEKKSFTRKVQEIRNAVEDDLLDFVRLEKRVKGKVDSAEKSIYKTARLYKGAPEEANRIVEMELAPIVDSAKKAGFTQNELSEYALMKHAEDVNAAGMESGFSDAEIAATLNKYANTPLEAERQKLMKLSDSLIENLQNDGVISQEQLSAMRQKWPNYMPLFRHFDDEKVDVAFGLGQAFSNVASPIKTLKGSTRDVIDPLESMVKNIYKSTDAGARNRVGLQLHELAKGNPTVNGIPLIRKLEPGETVGRKNVVNVKVNGEKIAYEVEPEVFSVFNNLDKEMSNAFISWMSKPASVLRAGATLTPEFAVRNPFRDVINAFVVSKSGFNPLTDFPAGLAATIKKDKLYQDWVKSGGGYGNIISMDRDVHRKALKDALKTPIQGKFINIINPKSWIATMRMISDVTESATKVGEFRAALRSGATPQEAAFRARDLMDFARAGHSVRPANRVIAFMNANIQGKSKLIRAISENPVKVTAKIASSMVLPTVGLVAFREKYASDEQKQTIKDAPDWLKNSFWLIPIPGSDKIARFPKPFDISLAANTTERFMDYMSDTDPDAFKGFIGATVKDQSIPTMLTGILPIIEGMANYSFFREGPIIPRTDQAVDKKYQFDSKTSHLARAAAGLAEQVAPSSNFASPRVMDYVIRSSTGGLGSYALDATDWIYGKATKSQFEKPTPTIEQRPTLKAFLVNPRTSGKSTELVYTTKEKLQNKKNTEKRGGDSLTDKELKTLSIAKDYAGQLSDLSSEIKKIEEDKFMSGDEKQRKITALVKQRNDLSYKGAEEIKRLSEKSIFD